MKSILQMILAKPEGTYGVDAVPTAAANWISAQDIECNPVQMETDDQKTVSNRYGQDEKIVGGIWSTISFAMPLRGGGVPLGQASTVPNFDPILRACGMARVLTAGTSCVYSLIESSEESVTLYWYMDKVMQKMTGVRGSWELRFNKMKQALLAFNGIGLRSAMTDSAGGVMPTPTLPTMPRPVAMNKDNTALLFGTLQARLSSFNIRQGNDVQYRNLTNVEDVVIADRQSGGSAVIELPTVAEKNFLGAGGVISAALTDSLSITHGTVPGNIVEIAVPKAQLFNPRLGNELGQAMLTCDMHIVRNDLTLTFK